jgi:predicted nucleotidyltransferase
MLVKKKISTPQKDQGEISEKRFSWLKERSRREAIESVADDISAAVKGGFLDDDVVREIIQNERDATIQSALVVGVRKAIEKNVETDIMRAKLLYARYEETLLLLWSKTTPEIRDELSTLFCRLHGLGIVGDNQLKALGIKIPDLSGSFSENIKSMESEVRDVRAMVEAIETDQQLSKYVYPTVIIYGSRLKGYGKESADIDLAVIVRPETPLNERDNIREKLKKLSHHEKVHGAITEFWLDETKNGLVVYDFEELDPNLGEKSWTHVLFGGAWEGDEKVIAELRRELLVPYFSKTDEIIHGRNARELYLEEMERDTLQYRLMHKGYERFYPSYGGMHTSHAASIDGKSAFWDSGYRIVATKLFANKVFLPEISSSK